MDLANMGLRLSKLRNLTGISARDMSLTLGKSPNYINKIERGKASPSMEMFFEICEFLKITQSDFFDDEISNPMKNAVLVSDFNKLDENNKDHVIGIVKGLQSRK